MHITGNKYQDFTILVLILLLTLANISNAEEHVWVSFADHGQYENLTFSELLELAKFQGLTKRSLERRRIEGITENQLVTLKDILPEIDYINGIEETGAEIHRISRWMNAVSVSCDQSTLAKIEKLPYVKSTSGVLKGKIASFAYEEVGTWESFASTLAYAGGSGKYGPSYLQNLQVNAVEAHDLGYNGQGVLMVVLDSGFELSHEAYEKIDVFAEYDFVEDDDYTGLEPAEDAKGQPGHGTGCLSVIGGYRPNNIIGIAHGATFILGKTEDVRVEVESEEDDWVAAVEWAERLGASVLSSSLSYQDWYELYEYDGQVSYADRAALHALELGMVLATSTGNEGPQPMTLGVPSSSAGVLGCGAVDSLGRIAKFSSRGPTADGRIKPDLVAMGVQTACVRPNTNHGYSRWNGTSLSTPVLGGVIAVVRGARPDWSAQKVIRALKSTASRSHCPDNIYGWGVPDIMAAINYDGE